MEVRPAYFFLSNLSLFFLLQIIQVIIHTFYMLRPVTVVIHIPCECFHGQPQFPADLCELLASPLDVPAFDAFLFTGNILLFPVLPVVFAMGTLFIIIAPAGSP